MLLRNYKITDVDDLCEYFGNEEVAKYEDFDPMDREKVTNLAHNWSSIDYDFNPAYGKKGYATEAAIHGITPQEAKLPGARLSLYPKISFQISIKGAVSMKYRIETMEPFRLAGKANVITTTNGNNFVQVPKMWDDFFADGTCDKIGSLNQSGGMFGVCYDFHFQEETFKYMIGVKPVVDVPKEYEVLEVPALTWVKFECTGVEGIQDVFKRMFTEWFPNSGYEHDEGPEIEWYPPCEGDDMKCEVWIPIHPIKEK